MTRQKSKQTRSKKSFVAGWRAIFSNWLWFWVKTSLLKVYFIYFFFFKSQTQKKFALFYFILFFFRKPKRSLLFFFYFQIQKKNKKYLIFYFGKNKSVVSLYCVCVCDKSTRGVLTIFSLVLVCGKKTLVCYWALATWIQQSFSLKIKMVCFDS